MKPALGALALALLAAGCVKEEVARPRGLRVTPSPGAASLPAGPAAAPAPAQTTSASVQVALEALGVVAYDGQALPVISPDGRFLAVQSGEPPDWPTILAEPGAQPATRTTLSVYDASGAALHEVTRPSLPPGAVLGRNADDQGFLIEVPTRDGPRALAHVGWLSGEVRYLARDEFVNSHALLLADGSLAYTRRAVDAPRRELCLRAPAGTLTTRADDGASYAFPLAGDDPAVLFAVRQGGSASALEAFRVESGRLGPALYRRDLAPSADLLLAHQMAVTSPGPRPAARAAASRGADAPLIALSPRHGRVAHLKGETGTFEPLPPRTVAASASPDPAAPGFYCATPDALLFVPAGWTGAATPVTVLSTPFVPRAVAGERPTLLLVGPVPRAPDRLEVLRLRPGVR